MIYKIFKYIYLLFNLLFIILNYRYSLIFNNMYPGIAQQAIFLTFGIFGFFGSRIFWFTYTNPEFVTNPSVASIESAHGKCGDPLNRDLLTRRRRREHREGACVDSKSRTVADPTEVFNLQKMCQLSWHKKRRAPTEWGIPGWILTQTAVFESKPQTRCG